MDTKKYQQQPEELLFPKPSFFFFHPFGKTPPSNKPFSKNRPSYNFKDT